MIHGHLHAHRGRAYTMLQQLPKVLNCGVDVNFLRPVTLAQLVENNALFYGPDSLRHFPEYTSKSVCRDGLLPRAAGFPPVAPAGERPQGAPGILFYDTTNLLKNYVLSLRDRLETRSCVVSAAR